MFKEGDKVPTFSIITDKKEFILKEINTNKTVVFFFPRANTSGCTKEAVELLMNDTDTEGIIMIGEIGGPQEAEAAAYIKEHVKKPVVAYVAGLTAPKGRTMGHAGAIISAFGESASEKVEILSAAGVTVAPNPAVIGDTIAKVMR